ncbi:hypothetical protein EV363DRAFT_1294390 [Boletus edulis]|nr:hypothetical protein EV363DRAFT_1294390 [Boletus edulis]
MCHRFTSDNNDTEPRESNNNTIHHPKRTRGWPWKVPRGQREINVESSQWIPTTPAKSYGRVIFHENSKIICIVSPALPGDGGSSQSAERNVTDDALTTPEVWLKDAAEHMQGAAIGGNLVMTQQVVQIGHYIACYTEVGDVQAWYQSLDLQDDLITLVQVLSTIDVQFQAGIAEKELKAKPGELCCHIRVQGARFSFTWKT